MSTTTTITDISASRILRLFPNDVNPTVIGSGQANESHTDLEGYDDEQVRLMDEVCIVIDADDKPIGSGSKKICSYPQIAVVSMRHANAGNRSSNGEYQSRAFAQGFLCLLVRQRK
jgi:hypothetical protein